MEAATSAFQHSYGLGPRYAAQQGHVPHPASAPGPSGAPRPEEPPQQQHHKPFFYIQPSQPYMPMQSMQWPVPVPVPMHVPYNPYYPGLGYGLPMMPHYQPNPYMEPPGFVVPTTHLHLMDYRRMLNPQYYQTMAYHSRRFRYQQNTPTRETTSSEVQTEPLSAAQKAGASGAGDVPVPVGLPVRKGGDDRTPGVSVKGLPSPAPSTHKSDPVADQKDVAGPGSVPRKQPGGSFVFQTEEVRIECCSTPVGLQLLHAHETKEVSHGFTQDVVQRSGPVLQGWRDEESCVPSEQALQACPDSMSVGETPPPTEEPETPVDPVVVSSDDDNDDSRPPARSDVQETNDEKDPSETCPFKVVHLPFDPKYLDELWKMESTVWSMKETASPSSESLIQNSRPESPDGIEDVSPVIGTPPVAEDELDDMVTAVGERPGDEVASEADACPAMDVPGAAEAPAMPLPAADYSPLKANGNEHQDTSFESLPAYLPSTSWLADFDNVYYCGTMPPTPTKQSRPAGGRGLDMPARRRRLDLDCKGQLAVRKPKERYKLKGKADRRSLSDHECCLSRSFNENAFAPHASKRERLCSRCVARSGVCEPAGPTLDGRAPKRKAAVFQQWNDPLLPTCDACRSHSEKKRLARKGSGPEARCPPRGRDSEGGESSENGGKWRAVAERRGKPNVTKMPLASKQNLEKPREKNCTCSERRSVAWERLRRCPHGNAIRETDENRAAPVSLQDKRRIMDHLYPTHRWQTENVWNAAIAHPDSDAARTPHFNNHKKSQSQGICRKDTRC
nr:uncharacterized protein buc2l [Gasterosteus aculeatus aculeatus]